MSQAAIVSWSPSWGRVTPRSSVAGQVPPPASTAGLVRLSAWVIMGADSSELPWVGPPLAASVPRPTLASPTLVWSPVPARAQVFPVSRLWPSLEIVPTQLVPLRARSVFCSSVKASEVSSLNTPPPLPVAVLSAIVALPKIVDPAIVYTPPPAPSALLPATVMLVAKPFAEDAQHTEPESLKMPPPLPLVVLLLIVALTTSVTPNRVQTPPPSPPTAWLPSTVESLSTRVPRSFAIPPPLPALAWLPLTRLLPPLGLLKQVEKSVPADRQKLESFRMPPPSPVVVVLLATASPAPMAELERLAIPPPPVPAVLPVIVTLLMTRVAASLWIPPPTPRQVLPVTTTLVSVRVAPGALWMPPPPPSAELPEMTTLVRVSVPKFSTPPPEPLVEFPLMVQSLSDRSPRFTIRPPPLQGGRIALAEPAASIDRHVVTTVISSTRAGSRRILERDVMARSSFRFGAWRTCVALRLSSVTSSCPLCRVAPASYDLPSL